MSFLTLCICALLVKVLVMVEVVENQLYTISISIEVQIFISIKVLSHNLLSFLTMGLKILNMVLRTPIALPIKKITPIIFLRKIIQYTALLIGGRMLLFTN